MLAQLSDSTRRKGFSGLGLTRLRSSAVWGLLTWRPRGLSKSVISRVVFGLTPFRVVIALLMTYLLSSLGLQVGFGEFSDGRWLRFS